MCTCHKRSCLYCCSESKDLRSSVQLEHNMFDHRLWKDLKIIEHIRKPLHESYRSLPASAAIAASVRSAERLRAMSAGHAARCGPRHRSDMPRVSPLPLVIASLLPRPATYQHYKNLAPHNIYILFTHI